MKQAIWFALLLGACSGGCSTTTPDPVEPTPQQEAGCAESCARGRQLGCEWAADGPGRDGDLGTADDVVCETVCLDYERQGIDMRNACVAAAETCLDADLCAQ